MSEASLTTRVGSVALRSPILTAAGTAGFGDELAGYGDLSRLGALVTKSLASFAWPGNPAPRIAAVGEHLINSVGLAGPGVAAWRQDYEPSLVATGATIVTSIWGRNTQEFADAADGLAESPAIALEVNASCPNLEDRATMFAHSPEATAAIVRATVSEKRPVWVKLSPNTPDLVRIAATAVDAGAEALVLVNTVLGLAIDVERRRPVLGGIGGGVSGPGIHPVALRAIFDCRRALPDVPIVGVGGVRSGEDAIAMLMAGASAVEVGTAIFASPRAPWRIQREVLSWLGSHGVADVREIIGVAHG
ncbi:MAG: dihydroorotate dehydrogenase [Actinomycetales bacterium]|nr:dihydroorotate dehydrogenase [Actinomycetales bacterium]